MHDPEPPGTPDSPGSPGNLAQWACVTEVCAPKAGNVHPGASFDDTTWIDFVVSSAVARPILDRAPERGVGNTVLDAVMATRDAVGKNTNLGLLLLLAPLCAASANAEIGEGVQQVLATLTPHDAEAVYEAIRLVRPGGLGSAPRGDVAQGPTAGLVEAMASAADRDAVARQYTNGFDDVLRVVAPRLDEIYREGTALDAAIVRAHLEQMAREPDSLIRRKCGEREAYESQRGAATVLNAGWPDREEGCRRFADLDAWLRDRGNARNPGTSADLVAGGLFAAFRRGKIMPPFRWACSVDPSSWT